MDSAVGVRHEARVEFVSLNQLRTIVKSMRRISLAFLLPLFGLLFWSVQASALITPLRTDGERFYLHKAENWQLAVVRIDMSPRFDIMEPDTIRHSWTVD